MIAGYEAVVLTEGGNVGTLNLYNSYYDRYRTESELKEVKPLASSIEQMAVSARDVFFLHQNGSILRWNADTKELPAVVKDLGGVKDIKEIKTGYNRLYMLKDDNSMLYPLELICEKLRIPLDWNRETGEVRLGGSSQ